uniref:CortBP2 domain-containing protein n=1 Tax=Panagrellus redivivus TaxID=6233 RepID=A0A7E5A130_PANRE
MNTTIKEDPSGRPKNIKRDYSKDELLKMLLHYETELDRKEKEIWDLKDDKTRSILNLAKYGQLQMGDPLAALTRDTAIAKEEIDESVLNVYEYQQRELERLCQLLKANHSKDKQAMQDLKRQHAALLEEMENDRRRRDAKNAQSEDIMSKLENARESLEKKLELKQDELDRMSKVLELERERRQAEAKRTKMMVFFLVKEHKRLVVEAHTKQQQLNDLAVAGKVIGSADSPLVKELRKEIKALREERDRLAGNVQKLTTQNSELDKRLKIKEEDCAVLRQTVNKKTQEQMNRIPGTVAGLVVANKGAQRIAPPMTRSKLPNSSTFPSTVPGTSQSNHVTTGIPATNANAHKKFPATSATGGNTTSVLPRPGNGRGLPTLGTRANLPANRTRMMPLHTSQTMPKQRTPSSEPQQSMNHESPHTPRPQSIGSVLAKRSSSLPRNNVGQPGSASEPASPRQGLPSPSAGISHLNYRPTNSLSRNMPSTMPSGKLSRMMPNNRQPPK